MTYTQLANGPLVPDEALKLAWSLEDRGFTLAAKGDKLLLHGHDTLSKADRANLKQWKPSILAIVGYQGPAV